MDPALQTAMSARAPGDSDEARLRYWAGRLAGPPPALELPADRPRPPAWSGRGARRPLTIPCGLASALIALGDREGLAPWIVLLTGFHGLLSRYSGQDDIVIAIPDESEGVGTPAGVLALRVDVSGEPSFCERLRRTGAAVAEMSGRGLPADRMAVLLAPGRDPSYPPLAQAWLAMQPGPMPGLVNQHDGTSHMDLAVNLWGSPEGLVGWIEYNSDIFDATTIDRVADHYRTLLGDAVADPDRPVGRLALLTEDERRQVLVEWNATAAAGPGVACIHHLVEAQAAKTPEAEAVVLGDRRLTYRALNRRANRLAGRLAALGVGPGVLVGICMERSPEMIVAVLGVLKAGGAYVPLDPDYPADRLDFMLADARAPLSLTRQGQIEGRPLGATRVIALDGPEEDEPPGVAFDRDHAGEAVADDLAYVIYTSGSTGRPKGVMLTHGGLCNAIATSVDAFAIDASDRMLQFTTLSFDVSVLEIFLALTTGAALVLVDRETVYSEERLAQLVAAERVTATFLMSSVLARLSPASLAGVRTIITGGESFSKGLVTRWAPGRAFYLAYGPTEATILQSRHRCRADDPGEPPTIGRPMPNLRFYVLDGHGEPVPIGVIGELYIGGIGLGRGYLHRPAATAEKFVPDPFGTEPGARLYRSGDLARSRPDGNLDFLGRMDTQVKIRGFRVDLGEIESLLRRHPDVRAAAVLVREDVPGDRRLVAYVVTASECSPAPADFRAFLSEWLPTYMLPAAFVPLDELPLTPNGKIDRRALPSPDGAGRERAQTYVAPRDPTEIALAAIWADVLGVDRVGLRDDFFELGGHSLLVVRLITAIGQTFGRTLPLNVVFRATTVEQMARLIAGVDASASGMTTAAGARRPFFTSSFGPTLARLLDHPVYSLEVDEADRRGRVGIEAMAERFVREIRAISPEGPYFLGGYSGMGVVMFEVAQQLHAQGQDVALLALFDPTSVTYIKKVSRSWFRPIFYVTRTVYRLAKILTLHPGRWPRRLRQYLKQGGQQLAYDLGFRDDLVRIPDYVYLETVIGRYNPRPYAGAVTLLMASDQSETADCDPPPYREWTALARGGLRTRIVPGDHFSMFEDPRVHELARELAACLDEAEVTGVSVP